MSDINLLRTLCNKRGFSCYTLKKDRFLTKDEMLRLLKPSKQVVSRVSDIKKTHEAFKPQGVKELQGVKEFQEPLEASKKARLIKEWYDTFKKYPDIFPNAYFRFLNANLEESFNNKTYIYKDGVLLTWKRYKKSHDHAVAKDYSLEKMISANPGNGRASIAMKQFLDMVKDDKCFLKVAKHNLRAICFYEKHGFKKVKEINFGSIEGLLMQRG